MSMILNPEKIYDFTLGIVGGGQLGKMLAQKAKTMGAKVVVLDPTPGSPAGEVSDKQIVSDFFNREGFLELARESDIVTYEFEHISAGFLRELEDQGYVVRPSATTLEIIQDKKRQKSFLAQNSIPVVNFAPVEDFEGLKTAVQELGVPAMLKSSKGGYDGKGNYLIELDGEKDELEPELEKAYNELGGDDNPMYLERFLDFEQEVSVMAARNGEGVVVNYPVVQNIHTESILQCTIAPAKISEQVKKRVEEISREIMSLFGDIGIFGIEFFVGKDQEAYVNEIAPRPHNSGHYTIEACDISQFETHLRAIMDLPLNQPVLTRPAVMMNLLGEDKEGNPVVNNLDKALEIEGLSFHLYRKKQSRPKRKMGHFTVCADTREKARKKAKEAFSRLKITGE